VTVRGRHRVGGRRQPRRLLLAAAMSVAIAATAGSLGYEVDGTLSPPSAPAGAFPLVAGSSSPVPPVATPPDATPGGQEGPASDPAGQLAVAGTMPASAPVRVQIPSIGVDSDLMDLGLQADGTLEVPPDGFPAGWYTGAPTPGEFGPAIIAGHVDWGGQPGVFFDLRAVSTGDEVAVTRQDGSIARFRVTHVDQFDKDTFPTQKVYGDLDHAGLRLITCGGSFDPQLRSYDDNLVVFAELIGNDPATVAASEPEHR